MARRTRRGGRKLGQGTQNAVFSVPFPCDPPTDRKTVMLVSLEALTGTLTSRRPLPAVLERLRILDPNAERFYYPLACSIRAPRDGEPIDEDLAGLSQADRDRLVPFVDIVPYGPNGTLRSHAVTKEIADTLRADIEFLHANGIAHGDVSPENIVFDEANRPHLIDFGQSSLRRGEDGVDVPKGFEEDIPSWTEAVALDWSDVTRSLRPRRSGRRLRRRRTIRRTSASGRA